MRLAALALATCLLLAFAGCGSKPPPTTSPSVQPTGTIEGRVLDTSQAVVPGAEVRVLLTSLVARTDGEGFYSIENAPAGAVRVVASADGFTSQTKTGTLAANRKVRLDFVLDEITRVQPYNETKQFSGTITCGLPQGVACPSDPGAPADPPSAVRFEVAPGLAGIVFELEWTPPAANVNTELSFDVQAASSQGCGARYNGTTGPSVLTLVVLEGFPISGGFQCVLVFPPSSNATVQQEFTMHYTLFYHAPPPAGFTALS